MLLGSVLSSGRGAGLPMSLCAFILVVAGLRARGEDWPQFGRDGSRNAVSPEKGAPTWWQFEKRDRQGKLVEAGKNVRWVVDLHARTYLNAPGDPVVAGGLVWVGCSQAADLGENQGLKFSPVLVCLDERTGEELYRRVTEPLLYLQEAGTRHGHGSSPYIEGETLWILTNRCEVVCLDIGPLQKRTGPPRERWVLDMYKDLGVRPRAAHFTHRRPSVASYKDWLFVITGNGAFWWQENNSIVVEAPEAPSLVCLEKATGKVVWQDNSPGKNIMHSQFATPTIIEVGGRAQVVAPLGDGWVRSFDPATGEKLWEYDTNPPGAGYYQSGGGNSDPLSANYLPASAVFHGGLLYIANGQEPEVSSGQGWLHCIDPTRSGDISHEFTRGPEKGKANSNSGLVWRFGGPGRWDMRTLANVAVADGLVFAPAIGGTVYCLDARTGKLKWEHETDRIKANPLVVDGRVFVATESGFFVFAVSATRQVEGPIGGESYSICSPVFANGVLYLMNDGYLTAIAGKEEPEKK